VIELLLDMNVSFISLKKYLFFFQSVIHIILRIGQNYRRKYFEIMYLLKQSSIWTKLGWIVLCFSHQKLKMATTRKQNYNMIIRENIFFSKTRNLTEPKMCMNSHWIVHYKISIFMWIGNPRWPPMQKFRNGPYGKNIFKLLLFL
jgi:hypothetical protein